MGTTNKKQLVVGKNYRVISGPYSITKIGSIVKLLSIQNKSLTIKVINTPVKGMDFIGKIFYDLKQKDLEEI